MSHFDTLKNDNELYIIVEKTTENAKIPTKGSDEAACFDVYAAHDAVVSFGKLTIVDLGFKVRVPKGYELVARPRSGLAFKHGITIVNSPGTIDSDYRGPLKIVLSSLNKSHSDIMSFKIKAGDRIAQLGLRPIPKYSFVEGKVENDTQRGEGGFGSTGS